MYRLLRFFLFSFPPEVAHHITLSSLKWLHKTGGLKFLTPKIIAQPVNVFGINFKNPVGLAAGFDKNGDYIDYLAQLGFGFIEVGAVTPIAQTGNPKPRLFRIGKKNALINRMGFNNKGVDYLVEKLKQRKTDCVIGVNIGKNKSTPLENAHYDYVHCLQKIYPYADFITINVSSPNTAELTKLQHPNYFKTLLHTIKEAGNKACQTHQQYTPILVKLSPDLSELDIRQILKTIADTKIDGIILGNTSQHREHVKNYRHGTQHGGLSGDPLTELSFRVLKYIDEITHGEIPIISCGGISSATEAQRRFTHGAALIQLYTGLIYKGPALIKKIVLAYRQMTSR